jgi:EF-P beta-lysylation protein EpmB
MLQLPTSYEGAARRAGRTFSVFAPHSYIARMQRGNLLDPLLRQVLPLEEELSRDPRYQEDPVGDAAATRTPGVLQKYCGRALMITTGACAVHCRYCFRRHYPYDDTSHSPSEWTRAVDQIGRDGSIDEVVLSGGDPLTHSDAYLAELAAMLARVPSLRRLRVHTRFPIVIPQRVTDELLAWLRGTRLLPVLVVQVNHPAELDDTVAAALARIADNGIQILNQSVLLRGVNDKLEVLVALSRRMLECRVLPYYLHQLDRVTGAAHFEVPVEEGLVLVAQMRRLLPGYAVPRYVRETRGEAAKSILA